jgi:hypothetical protein
MALVNNQPTATSPLAAGPVRANLEGLDTRLTAVEGGGGGGGGAVAIYSPNDPNLPANGGPVANGAFWFDSTGANMQLKIRVVGGWMNIG